MTGRERVLAALSGVGPDRAPRDIWFLPWAKQNYPEAFKGLLEKYPGDFATMTGDCPPSPVRRGDPYVVGEYVDEWGAVWSNIHPGIVGEVKRPIVTQDDWSDGASVRIPEEQLEFSVEAANKSCSPESFRLAGCLPRPFEQLQFIRGTENLYIDLMMRPAGLFAFIERMHAFYLRLVEKWCQTDCDAIFFMDDWGSQNALLINPALFQEIFLPMYRDYIDMAHRYGKKAFMHSDGNILSIIPMLIDAGLDALNSQIFCMGLDSLAPYAGKLTFWGEIDRQHLLPKASAQEICESVAAVHKTLWKNGKCIAQCEFGPGAKPENVFAVFEAWNRLTKRKESL